MKIDQLIKQLGLTVLSSNLEDEALMPAGVYCSDMLSCVMAGALHKSIWVTLQSHHNIVAVAALLELSAIIITEGAMPDDATIEKAKKEGITLLSTPQKSFEICGRLWELGFRA